MGKTVDGIVRGRTIELSDDAGLVEGQQVRVTIHSVPSTGTEGLRRCAGTLVGTVEGEDERILRELDEDRRRAQWRDLTG